MSDVMTGIFVIHTFSSSDKTPARDEEKKNFFPFCLQRK